MRKIVRAILVVGAFGVVLPLLSQTQTPANKGASFEVVSVKPSPPDNRVSGGGPRGDRYDMSGVTLRNLVQAGYQRLDSTGRPGPRLQIIGGPSWIDADRFNVQATADCSGGPIPRDRMQLMVQALLEDRFQLKAHYEIRELPVYDLVVARDGVKMKPSADQSPPSGPAVPVTLCGAPPAGPRTVAPVDVNGPLPRGTMLFMISGLRESLRGTAVPIGNIVSALQNQAGRPVIDKTGLKALFDMTLEFSLETQPALTPPPSPSAAGGGTAVPGGIQANAAEPAPSLFTAVQEQLGLKLESAKGMVEVLVIDSAQKPTEN